MENVMLVGLMLAGILAMVMLPVVVWAMIGMNRSFRRLEERNAAQAVTIGRLELELRERGAIPNVQARPGGGADVDWRGGERR